MEGAGELFERFRLPVSLVADDCSVSSSCSALAGTRCVDVTNEDHSELKSSIQC